MTGRLSLVSVVAVVALSVSACAGSTARGAAPGAGPSSSPPTAGSPATRDVQSPAPSARTSPDPSRPARSGTGSSSAAPLTTTSGDAADLTGLPEATTFTTVTGLRSVGPIVPDGVVIHPRAAVAVAAEPGGPAVAALPASQLGSPTWVPVLREVDGWSQVLLPSRPNGSTGWVGTGDHDGFDLARSDSVVHVRLREARMIIERDGRQVGSWPVVVGAPATPTPIGTTFVMASVDDVDNAYSRYLLPLGWHSDTLDSFGGGPGTVAVHGWRDASVFTRRDRELSHGCVRVPAAALSVARSLPLGTPVVIS